MTEQELRLECLKLILSSYNFENTIYTPEQLIADAKKLYEFIIG
jgi:hypothetical protein